MLVVFCGPSSFQESLQLQCRSLHPDTSAVWRWCKGLHPVRVALCPPVVCFYCLCTLTNVGVLVSSSRSGPLQLLLLHLDTLAVWRGGEGFRYVD